jgi:predicted nucleic acid-binding protein
LSVVDASVMVFAISDPDGLRLDVSDLLTGRLQVPAVFPAEVTSGLRGLVIRRAITPESASDARQRLRKARLRLHPFRYYAERVWELRNNLSVYDAWYVALAERLEQPLITRDAAILRAPGLRCALIDAR